MQLFAGILASNATVRIETLTTARDSAGGQVETYTTLATDVPCLVSQLGGNRDGRFRGTDSISTGTCTGNHEGLGRGDIRLYFLTGPAAGLYARADSAENHGPAGGYSLIENFYRVKWSSIQIGA